MPPLGQGKCDTGEMLHDLEPFCYRGEKVEIWLPCLNKWKYDREIHLLRHETEKLEVKAFTGLLFCVFSINLGSFDLAAIFDQGFLVRGHAVLGFNGEFVKQPRRRKKLKIVTVLEEGDLLFNLVLAVWFLFLGLVFGRGFKVFLPYKNGLLIFYFLISALLINLIFKIVDIYMVYTKESLSDKIHRELQEKRKIKQKPS